MNVRLLCGRDRPAVRAHSAVKSGRFDPKSIHCRSGPAGVRHRGRGISAPTAAALMRAPGVLAVLLLRLGRARLGNEAGDELPDRALRDACVDPGLAGLCAAVAEAGGTGEPEAVALLQRREKRA